jgi:2,5-diketo-D-gluconate reductase A
MSTIPSISFNDGRSIPQFGLGVWQVKQADAASVIHSALEAGYRHIDTAAAYGNEAGVGEGIRTGSVPREEIFVTTKLWNDRHDHEDAQQALRESLDRLGLDSVDLYLIHWPAPERDLYVEAWKALIKLREAGLAKSIGVSNFTVANLQRLLDETGVVPAVNQIELHPLFQQEELRAFHTRHGIVTESWSPLARGGELLEHPLFVELGQKYGKTPAQVILRWHIDLGLVVFPKSSHPARIKENIDIFDFSLEPGDIEKIATLNENKRIGPDPLKFS